MLLEVEPRRGKKNLEGGQRGQNVCCVMSLMHDPYLKLSYFSVLQVSMSISSIPTFGLPITVITATAPTPTTEATTGLTAMPKSIATTTETYWSAKLEFGSTTTTPDHLDVNTSYTETILIVVCVLLLVALVLGMTFFLVIF